MSDLPVRAASLAALALLVTAGLGAGPADAAVPTGLPGVVSAAQTTSAGHHHAKPKKGKHKSGTSTKGTKPGKGGTVVCTLSGCHVVG